MLPLILSYFVFKISVPSINASGKLKIEVLYSVCTHDYCWMMRQFDKAKIFKKLNINLNQKGLKNYQRDILQKTWSNWVCKDSAHMYKNICYRDIWFVLLIYSHAFVQMRIPYVKYYKCLNLYLKTTSWDICILFCICYQMVKCFVPCSFLSYHLNSV